MDERVMDETKFENPEVHWGNVDTEEEGEVSEE
jgi:hypothetical protein